LLGAKRRRQGIVPELASILSGFEVNIDNMRAIALASDNGQSPVVLVFEVTVPASVHQNALRQALFLKAEELGLSASIQHRKIFEAINRL
jgi:glycine cleavage system transcriptional repressor